jgi:hypothetical protein
VFRNRLVGLGVSVLAGILVQLIVRTPVLSLLAFLASAVASLFVLAKGLPIRIYRERSLRTLVGYEGCYPNQQAASDDIVESARATRRLDIALIRGHRFVLLDDSLLDRMLNGAMNAETRVLLLDPAGQAMRRYLEHRKFSLQESTEYIATCEQVRTKLDRLGHSGALEYRYYDFLPSWRLIINDAHVFVAPYDAMRRGSELPYVRFGNMGRPYFVAYSNGFNEIWNRLSKGPVRD